jgi:hypothetical protein
MSFFWSQAAYLSMHMGSLKLVFNELLSSIDSRESMSLGHADRPAQFKIISILYLGGKPW